MFTEIGDDTGLFHKSGKKGRVMTKASKKQRKLDKLEQKLSEGKTSSSRSLEEIESQRARQGLSSSWSEGINETKREALPVIKKGKVMRVLVEDTSAPEEEVKEDLNEFTVSRMRKGKAKREAMAALKKEKDAKLAIESGNGDGDGEGEFHSEDEDGSGSDDGEGDYNFRPEFHSKAEALADYGLDEESQSASVSSKAQTRRAGPIDEHSDSDDPGVDGEEVEKTQAAVQDDNKGDSGDKKELSKNALRVRKRMRGLSRLGAPRIKAHIAAISRKVLSNPEEALKRKAKKGGSHGNDGQDEQEDKEDEYHMTDLFDILTANSGAKGDNAAPEKIFPSSVIECAMLSLLLIFKDICPGYKIRPPQENVSMQDVRLKKETKRMRDYEFALLGAYQRYLKFLANQVTKGLSNPKKQVREWTVDALLGVSALRCQCELIKALPFFNFRQKLLLSVVSRAAQPSEEVTSIACMALESMFQRDQEWDASLEAIKAMAALLRERASVMHTVPEGFLRVLLSVKLHIKADIGKSLKKQAKKEKRKRKRAGAEDAAAQMLEANSDHDALMRSKAQAQCLHEVCLLYFRVVKGKIGFRLLPLALEGLGRVSHLINTDTVEDLVSVMRDLLENPASLPPPNVRVQCILCALRTLSGPGEHLNIDMDFFASSLLQLMRELSCVSFERWDYVLECVDICMVRKREERSAPIVHFIRALMHVAPHLPTAAAGAACVAMAHKMLLRYPRIRSRLLVFTPVEAQTLQQDEEVSDLAMQALRSESGDLGRTTDAFDSSGTADDGTWVLPLLHRGADPQVGKAVDVLSSREIVPLPLRFDSAICSQDALFERLELALNAAPPSLQEAINLHLKLPAGTDLTIKANDKNGKVRKLDKHQRMLQKKLLGGGSLSHPSFLDSVEQSKRLRVDWGGVFHQLSAMHTS